MDAEKRIEELGIELPASSPAKAMYIPAKRVGSTLYVSGQIPMLGGEMPLRGRAGAELTLEQAQEAARTCTINLLAVVRSELGSLDAVRNVVKLQGFVASAEGFFEQHLVVNAASQLLFDVFGEAGRHARTAVAVPALPMNAPVEIEAIFEVGGDA
jgi:enamine deaminase RidA (YjgF/YER057c/UK114 family)